MKPEKGSDLYIISCDFVEKFSSILGDKLQILTSFPGMFFNELMFAEDFEISYKLQLSVCINKYIFYVLVLGLALLQATYSIPALNKSSPLPVVPGHHVATDKGTGLVHTAPPHGPEDFQIALSNQLPMVRLNDLLYSVYGLTIDLFHV